MPSFSLLLSLKLNAVVDSGSKPLEGFFLELYGETFKSHSDKWNAFLTSLATTRYWTEGEKPLVEIQCNSQLVQDSSNCYVYAIVNALARVAPLQEFFKTHPGPLRSFIMHTRDSNTNTCPVPPDKFPVGVQENGGQAHQVLCAILMILQKDPQFANIKFYTIDVYHDAEGTHECQVEVRSPENPFKKAWGVTEFDYAGGRKGFQVVFTLPNHKLLMGSIYSLLKDLFQQGRDACFYVTFPKPLPIIEGLHLLRLLLIKHENIQLIQVEIGGGRSPRHAISLVRCGGSVHLITNWADNSQSTACNMFTERVKHLQTYKEIHNISVWVHSASTAAVARTVGAYNLRF